MGLFRGSGLEFVSSGLLLRLCFLKIFERVVYVSAFLCVELCSLEFGFALLGAPTRAMLSHKLSAVSAC